LKQRNRIIANPNPLSAQIYIAVRNKCKIAHVTSRITNRPKTPSMQNVSQSDTLLFMG